MIACTKCCGMMAQMKTIATMSEKWAAVKQTCKASWSNHDSDCGRYCGPCSEKIRGRKNQREREKTGATINSTLAMRGEKARERLRGRREGLRGEKTGPKNETLSFTSQNGSFIQYSNNWGQKKQPMRVQHSHEHTYSNKPLREPHVHRLIFASLDKQSIAFTSSKTNETMET